MIFIKMIFINRRSSLNNIYSKKHLDYLFILKAAALILFFTLLNSTLTAQPGCTDPRAQNYNPSATINDGSCTYVQASANLTDPKVLPASLNENSGLIYSGGSLWTLNDGGNAASIFKISETDGSILQTVNITNATNLDWEAISADANYIYIGDFGNNVNGNRTNLKIYRISKTALGTNATVNVTADIIHFSYQDQIIQSPVTTGVNQTKFDCEAFLVMNDQLHLFTKDWIDGHTKHYILPTLPGNHVAASVEEFNVNGLITGASISPTNHNEIVLIGYSTNLLNLFMWVLHDYTVSNFFNGNKRRFELGFSLDKGQIEGVSFTANGNGYISSERINQPPFIVPPRLYSFSIANLISLPIKLLNFTASYTHPEVTISWQTAAEMNADYFVIERAADEIHFKEIGRQKASPNSTNILSYQYIDRKPFAGTSYYRLKLVNLDGTQVVYDVKTIKVEVSSTKLQAYPSPATNTLIININKPLPPKSTYHVVDLNGAIVKQGKLQTSKQPIDITNLAQGQYILKVSFGESVQFQKK